MPAANAILPSLIIEALTIVASFDAPASDLVSRVIDRTRLAPDDEIEEALNGLWPLARHIDYHHVLSEISSARREGIPLPALRPDVEQQLREPEGDFDDSRAAEFRAQLSKARNFIRARWDAAKATQESAISRTVDLDPEMVAGQDTVDLEPSVVVSDPLMRFLPAVDRYWAHKYWYTGFIDDEIDHILPLLRALAAELSERLGEDPIFWAVLGRTLEPFRFEDPDDLDDRIHSGRQHTIAVRLRTGRADLHDYWESLPSPDEDDDDDDDDDDGPDPVYGLFLSAIERASGAECEAFFCALEREDLELVAPEEYRPFPAERTLPIADNIWTAILSKSDLSCALVARAGLYYWHSDALTAKSPLALAALGRHCEGIERDHWEVPPFLCFWEAARLATAQQQLDLATVCLKRALVDLAIEAQFRGDELEHHLEAFTCDPRFIKTLYAHARPQGPAAHRTFALAFSSALDTLEESTLHEWSHVRFVLSEVFRRLGVTRADDSHLIALLGEELYRLLDAKTRYLLAEAEDAWASLEERLVISPDYGQIAWRYRQAIEHECSLRLKSWLPMLKNINPNLNADRPELGKVLWALRHSGSIGHQIFMGRARPELHANTRLFDEPFLLRASRMVDRYLNEGTHRGLSRKGCSDLRAELFDQHVLRDLLFSVQPAVPAGPRSPL